MSAPPEPQESTWRLGEIFGGIWSQSDLAAALQEIAEGICQFAGFGVAAISVLRDNNQLEVVAVAGDADARATLLNDRWSMSTLEANIDMSDRWGKLCFVPAERVEGQRLDEPGWVPDEVPGNAEGPDAWQAMDLLFVPLEDDEGGLSGVLAVDLPIDGRRPGKERQELVSRYAAHSARAVAALMDRDRLIERARLSDAVRPIVREAIATLEVDQLLTACQPAIMNSFAASGTWIQAFDDVGDGPGAIYAAEEARIHLGEHLMELAREAAETCWREQRVAIVSRTNDMAPLLDPEPRDEVLEFLDSIGGRTMLFAPLGVGQECLGNLVLIRAEAKEWTRAESDAALDISHDLGQAIFNARLFSSERRLLAELREIDAFKGQLISTVSHEFKTPLTAIRAHAELLALSPLEPEDAELVTGIGRNTERLTDLVNDLLVLSRVRDSRRPLDAQRVDLRGIARDAAELLRVQAATREIALRVNEGSPVLVAVEPAEIARATSNLVSNAVKYSDPGGVVEIDVSRVDGVARLSIRDRGIGISVEDQERLFEEFFRSTNPEARARPGTGLGLAIVERIAHRHQGQVAVESAPGRGSVFTLELPAGHRASTD